jgi:tRNA A37 threonylcarbamoyladenosine synthetase subunit TsaC/SUA5/YrdC
VLAEIIKIHQDNPEASLVRYAAEQIKAGQVLGMPTDTFYGLAADPLNLRAVERVYEIKSRSRHKPLSLLIERLRNLRAPCPRSSTILRAASGLVRSPSSCRLPPSCP